MNMLTTNNGRKGDSRCPLTDITNTSSDIANSPRHCALSNCQSFLTANTHYIQLQYINVQRKANTIKITVTSFSN